MHSVVLLENVQLQIRAARACVKSYAQFLFAHTVHLVLPMDWGTPIQNICKSCRTPEECPSVIADLCLACTSQDAKKRPTAQEVMGVIENSLLVIPGTSIAEVAAADAMLGPINPSSELRPLEAVLHMSDAA